MKPTAFAFATIVLAAIPLGSQVVTLADSPPKLKIGSSCDGAKGAISAGRDKEACLGDELAAREQGIGRSIPVLIKPNPSP